MPDRDDFIQRLRGRVGAIEPQIIPDVIYSTGCWTTPAGRTWTWSIPDDGFDWHIITFSGAAYPTVVLYADLLVDSVYAYRYAGPYCWMYRTERKQAPVLPPGATLVIRVLNLYEYEICVSWAIQFHRELA